MQPDEAFVSKSLVEYLGGSSVVTALDGEDPPDFYLAFEESRIGVEATRLSQFTIKSDGSLGNRRTQDSFGVRLIEELNTKIGPSLPNEISLLIFLWLPVSKPSKFRKDLFKWVTEIAAAPEKVIREEKQVYGSKTIISVMPARPSGKKIVGCVANNNSSPDIGFNARIILENRIRVKSEICSSLPRPIWLALLNDYWLADTKSFMLAYQQIKLSHCFQRIFIVSDDGTVDELTAKL